MSTILDALRKAQKRGSAEAPRASVEEGGDHEIRDARPEVERTIDDSFDDLRPPGSAATRRTSNIAIAGLAILGSAIGFYVATLWTGRWTPPYPFTQARHGPKAGGPKAAQRASDGEASSKVADAKRAKDAAAPAAAKKPPTVLPTPGGPVAAAQPSPGVAAAVPGAPSAMPAANVNVAAPPSRPPAGVGAAPGAGPSPVAAVPAQPTLAAPSGASVGAAPAIAPSLAPGAALQPGAGGPKALGNATATPPTGAIAAPGPGQPGGTSPAAAMPVAGQGAPAPAVNSPPPIVVGAEAPPVAVLQGPPSGAPEVTLLFIQYSRDAARRVASLRVAGGKLMLVHEGDTIEGMRVAAIRSDALELEWSGTRFRMLAVR